jgi:hypothetical protein
VFPGILCRSNARSYINFDIVVLLRRRSEGGMNNFVREDASVIKERVARRGQVLPKRRLTECVKHIYIRINDFGGLVVSMLASGTKDHGFDPGRILSMPSFGRKIKPFA